MIKTWLSARKERKRKEWAEHEEFCKKSFTEKADWFLTHAYGPKPLMERNLSCGLGYALLAFTEALKEKSNE